MSRARADGAADAFADEVRALHLHLEDWLKGKVPRGDGMPVRLAAALTSASSARRRSTWGCGHGIGAIREVILFVPASA